MPHIRTTPHGIPHDVCNDVRNTFGDIRSPHTLCTRHAASHATARTQGRAQGRTAASDAALCDAPGHGGPTRWLGVPRFPRPLPFFLCLIGLLPTLLTGCGDNTPPGEVATMRACRICHGTDRICADIGRLDRAGWEKTVDRMIAGGASVTPEERTAVIDWLATRKPGEAPLCP